MYVDQGDYYPHSRIKISMLTGKELFGAVCESGLEFVTGVPCSVFKDFLIYLNEHTQDMRHVGATSEGEAIGIAAGYHLATGKVPLVYMQNSGLGNAVNPLTSLMDTEVYSIPALLFISWRGEPGIKDEPQHKKMGRIMVQLLEVLEIPYEVVGGDPTELASQISRLAARAQVENRPMALIFQLNAMAKGSPELPPSGALSREQTLTMLLEKIGSQPVIGTTGKTSREIFEIRARLHQKHETDFLTVGSMGCSSAVALGAALSSKKNFFLIDGDGALLMKMGTLATIGAYQPERLTHIVIDNGAYESTGGQPTSSGIVHWRTLFESLGYKNVIEASTAADITAITLSENMGPQAIVVKVATGSRPDLGRPTETTQESKHSFMRFIRAE